MPKKTPTRRQPSKKTHQSEIVHLGERFERAFCVFDSAITGAVIAGVNPFTFAPILSFHFLQVALGAREKPPNSNPSQALDTFESVLESVERAFGETRELPNLVEEKRFFELKATCNNSEQSELDRRRDTKKAMAIVEWCFQRLSSDEELELVLVELALLVAYLKVSALAGETHELLYLTARENPPMLLMAYHEVLAD